MMFTSLTWQDRLPKRECHLAVVSKEFVQVSNTEAVNLLRQVLAMRNKNGQEAGELSPEGTGEPMVAEDSPSASSIPVADLPSSAAHNLTPQAEQAAKDPTIESTEASKAAAMKPFPYRLEPEPAQIQAGCTAVVAVFQASPAPSMIFSFGGELVQALSHGDAQPPAAQFLFKMHSEPWTLNDRTNLRS